MKTETKVLIYVAGFLLSLLFIIPTKFISLILFCGIVAYRGFKGSEVTWKKVLGIIATVIGSISILFSGVVFSFSMDDEEKAEEKNKDEAYKEDEPKEEPKKKEEPDREAPKPEPEPNQSEEYLRQGQGVIELTGHSLQLYGQGFINWSQGRPNGVGMVENAVKELDGHVNTVDNDLTPSENQKELHKELVDFVTEVRDVSKEGYEAAKRQDIVKMNQVEERMKDLETKGIYLKHKFKTD